MHTNGPLQRIANRIVEELDRAEQDLKAIEAAFHAPSLVRPVGSRSRWGTMRSIGLKEQTEGGERMPLSEENATELEAMRTRLVEMLAPLQREGTLPDSQDSREQTIHTSLWSAVRALDVLLREEHAPVDLDLDQNDETTRQILYGFVIWDYFTPHALEDSGDITVPRYTPEESDLRVFFDYGRWFVTWLKLEKDSKASEAQRRELLVVDKDENGVLVLSEV